MEQLKEEPRDPVRDHAGQEGSSTGEKTYPRRILVRDRRTIYFVNVDRIRWVGAEGPYVSLHTPEGTHLLRMCIGDVEEILPPGTFARIHRSAMVNLDSVVRMLSLDNGKCAVVLDDDTQLVMSRSFRDGLLRRFAISPNRSAREPS